MDSYRYSQRRKGRKMEERNIIKSLIPDCLLHSTFKRLVKLRMRVAVTLGTGVLIMYIICSHATVSPSNENQNQNQDQRISGTNAEKRIWKISDKSRRNPVAVDKIIDSQAHAPEQVRLLAPFLKDEKYGKHIPPGFVGVGGEGNMLQPPPGPALKKRIVQANGGHSNMGHKDRFNPKMRFGGIDPADPGGGGTGAQTGMVGGKRVHRGEHPRELGKYNGVNKVGPPGQSNAMHLVEGVVDSNHNIFPEPVLAAPKIESVAMGGMGSYGAYRSSSKTSPPKYVYLDLKVGPPKVAYIIQLLPILATLGATGVILDYEDNFPYKGSLAVLSSPKAYKLSGIQRIFKKANEFNLNIIPLVQTFSNTEFILKHKQFNHLREHPRLDQNLNPLKNETLELTSQMLHQVLQAHPGSKAVHIGCEDIYKLGYSPETKAYLAKNRGAKVADLYLNYITAVANHVRSKYPDMRIIVWDKVIRSISTPILKHHTQLASLIEPMISVTSMDVVALPPDIIQKYASQFRNIWLSTTFNNPITSLVTVPSFYKYITHQRAWLDKLAELQTTSINICGVALIGKFRRSHFSLLPPVLLPVALPSLALCLRTLTLGEYNRTVVNDVMTALECRQHRPMSEDDPWGSFTWCKFPGSALFGDFVEVRQNMILIKQIINTQGQKDISHIVRKFEELLTRLPRHLVSIYGQELALEWLDGHVINNLSALGGFKVKAKSMLDSNPWLNKPKDKLGAYTQQSR